MRLDTIIDRVRGLDGPDREVDRDVHVLLVGPVIDFPLSGPWQENGIAAVPAYTASLDAVVSLIERELPGKHWSISKSYGPHSPMRSFGDGDFDAKCGSWGDQKRAAHDAPTLALLLAFLTVMKEMVQ